MPSAGSSSLRSLTSGDHPPGHVPGIASAATIAQKKAQAAHIAAQVSALNTKMEFAVEAYDAASQKLDTSAPRSRRTSTKLIVARYNLLVARQLLTQRVVNIYKQDKTDMLDVLLSTKKLQRPRDRGLRHAPDGPERQRHGQHDHRPEEADQPAARRAAGRGQAGRDPRRPARGHQAAGRRRPGRAPDQAQGRQAADLRHAGGRRAAAKAGRQRAAAAAAAAQAAPPQISSGGGGGGGGGTTSSAGSHSSVVSIAQQYLGVPYVWGGASPPASTAPASPCTATPRSASRCPTATAMQYADITPVALRLRAARRPRLLRLLGRRHPPRRHLRRRRLHDRRALHRRRRALRLGLQRRLLRVGPTLERRSERARTGDTPPHSPSRRLEA